MQVTRCLALFTVAIAAAQQSALLDGIRAYDRGDYAAAERSLTLAVSDARGRAFLALVQAATGRCEQALTGLAQGAEATDGTVRRLSSLGQVRCLAALNRLDDASAAVNRLKSENPSDADVLYESARIHMRAWNETLQQLYKSNAASYRVNQISAEIFETRGQFEQAATEYRKAIAKNPNALNLHFRLGRALLLRDPSPENLQLAMTEFEEEIRRNPADAVAHYQVGQVLVAQNKPAAAAPRFARSIELKPDFPEALIALARIHLNAKRASEAIALLQRAVHLAPKSEAIHYSLMQAYRDAGRMDEARREKATLDEIQKTPDGEFSEFLKKLGEKPDKR
jgi:tetratricopeptide (TPR) repeat protein